MAGLDAKPLAVEAGCSKCNKSFTSELIPITWRGPVYCPDCRPEGPVDYSRIFEYHPELRREQDAKS